MPYVSDIKLNEKIRVLVYGASKSGKTFGAASFPRPNYLCFDPDGIKTLVGKDFLAKYSNAGIMYETFVETSRDARGIVMSHTAYDNGCRYFDQCMKRDGNWKGMKVNPEMFDTWVLDSGTTLSEVALNKAAILLGSKAYGEMSQTQKQALTHGLLFPKIQDWGAERSMTEQYVQMLLDTDKHIVLLCHEKEVTDKSGSLTAITPLFTGKGVQAICLKFDELWNLRVEKSGPDLKRLLYTRGDGLRLGGTRYGIADGTEWNYNAIVAQLNTIQQVNTSANHQP